MSLLLPVLLAAAALATEEARIGIFIGNDEGATGQLPLVFATRDARKMRDLFVDLGEIEADDAFLLQDATRRQVQGTFAGIAPRLEAARTAGQHTTLVVYYSGHGDEEGLQLGTTRIGHQELRAWAEGSGADVRLILLDACRSGAAVRQKGATRGPSYSFSVAAEAAKGTAVLTSSAASELSQESEELGGGFFTHYLHTALTGAADRDADGDVTLTEAYAFVHGETAFATRETPGAQTPSYDLDLTGAGALRLTRLEQADAWLSFPGGLDGTYAVWDEARKRYVAEVRGERPTRVAVRHGLHFVHHRMPGWVDQAEYHVPRGGEVTVGETDFVTVAYEDTASRGDLRKQVRRAQRSDLSLRLGIGSRGFGKELASTYLPDHPVIRLEGRWLDPRRAAPWYGVDLITGAAAGTVEIPEIGGVDVLVRSFSIGGSAGFATRPRWIRAGAALRAELVVVGRDFLVLDQPDQGMTTFAGGAGAWAGTQWGPVNLEIELDVMIPPVRFDDHDRLASYGQLFLVLGYRL